MRRGVFVALGLLVAVSRAQAEENLAAPAIGVPMVFTCSGGAASCRVHCLSPYGGSGAVVVDGIREMIVTQVAPGTVHIDVRSPNDPRIPYAIVQGHSCLFHGCTETVIG